MTTKIGVETTLMREVENLTNEVAQARYTFKGMADTMEGMRNTLTDIRDVLQEISDKRSVPSPITVDPYQPPEPEPEIEPKYAIGHLFSPTDGYLSEVGVRSLKALLNVDPRLAYPSDDGTRKSYFIYKVRNDNGGATVVYQWMEEDCTWKVVR